MEIILTKEDVENIVKEHYTGVETVNVQGSSKFKIIVKLKDLSSLKKNRPLPNINLPPAEPSREKTLEERNEESLKNGGMVSGGESRALARF